MLSYKERYECQVVETLENLSHAIVLMFQSGGYTYDRKLDLVSGPHFRTPVPMATAVAHMIAGSVVAILAEQETE